MAQKRKPQVIEIDADDEGPTEAVIVVDNAGTIKDNRLVDVTFVADGDVLLVSFHVLKIRRSKARAEVRKFVSSRREHNSYLLIYRFFTLSYVI